jgi:hypothetical protein
MAIKRKKIKKRIKKRKGEGEKIIYCQINKGK